MSKLEVGGKTLSIIHRKTNATKFGSYFVGFLEGILASESIEEGEIDPLITQCYDFAQNLGDEDAYEIIEDFGAELLELGSLQNIVDIRVEEIDVSCEKSGINQFMGFCAGIACDNRISLKEAEGVVRRAETSIAIQSDGLSRAVVLSCQDALEDGFISRGESEEICATISKLVGDSYADTGLSALGGVPIFEDTVTRLAEGDILEKTFVLTGSFSISPRRIIEDAIAELGGSISRTVSKKTDYLIVASEASRDWIHTHKGTKIDKALQLRDVHAKPAIIEEYTLLKVVSIQ